MFLIEEIPMRKSVALLAALALTAAPSVALAKSKSHHHYVRHHAKVKMVKSHPDFVGDALSQIFVPIASMSHSAKSAAHKKAETHRRHWHKRRVSYRHHKSKKKKM